MQELSRCSDRVGIFADYLERLFRQCRREHGKQRAGMELLLTLHRKLQFRDEPLTASSLRCVGCCVSSDLSTELIQDRFEAIGDDSIFRTVDVIHIECETVHATCIVSASAGVNYSSGKERYVCQNPNRFGRGLTECPSHRSHRQEVRI